MKILNIHTRDINQPKDKVVELFSMLATEQDKVWPTEKWPAIRFKNGLKVGSEGGHGPIRYTVEKYEPTDVIQFKFSKPKGFNGYHTFEITEKGKHTTEIKHTLEMNTVGVGTFTWLIAIKWLHDALIEDAFDKVENHFSNNKKRTEWNLWVKTLRRILEPEKKRGK